MASAAERCGLCGECSLLPDCRSWREHRPVYGPRFKAWTSPVEVARVICLRSRAWFLTADSDIPLSQCNLRAARPKNRAGRFSAGFLKLRSKTGFQLWVIACQAGRDSIGVLMGDLVDVSLRCHPLVLHPFTHRFDGQVGSGTLTPS